MYSPTLSLTELGSPLMMNFEEIVLFFFAYLCATDLDFSLEGVDGFITISQTPNLFRHPFILDLHSKQYISSNRGTSLSKDPSFFFHCVFMDLLQAGKAYGEGLF